MARLGAGQRRGVLLLVVLALLVLLVAVAFSFISVTSRYRSATSEISRHPQVGTNARGELDMAMYQLVRGTRNSQSSLLGHDLLSDLYGFDGFQGRIASATVPSGMGGQVIDLTVDTTSPVTNVLGDPITLDTGSGYYSGCVLTVVFDAVRSVSTRIVGYHAGPKRFRVLALGLQQKDSPSFANFSGAKFVVNGRPFNGTGVGWNAATGALDALENGHPMALLPDRSPAAQGGVPWSSYVRGGPDESYDAPDFQNVFLALSTTNPSETAPGSIVNPSFHRRALVNYWLKQTGGDLPDDLLRKIVLRPNEVDHPNFPRLESLVAGPWDIDNDGDGVRDSVWIDVGFPTQSTRDGRVCKPLFAFLCVDMDSRLNLNAHGSLTTAKILPEPEPVRVAGGRTTYDLNLPRGQGYGPAEINLHKLFWDPADRCSLLFGDPERRVSGRYGLDRVIGDPHIDRWTTGKFREYPANYLAAAMAGRLTAFSSPPDLCGRTAMGLDERGDPVYEGLDETVVDNEYEMDLSRGMANNIVNSPASDDPISVAELERVLRPHDVDATSLPPRLWQTLRSFRDGPTAAENRRTVTTDSFDLPVPAVLASRETRGWFSNDVATFPRGRPLHVIDLLRARLISAGFSPKACDPEVAAMLAPELTMGLRMDVNRPFGNARDDNGNGTVDEPGEAAAGGGLARHYLARHLYVLLMLLTDPDYLHPVDPAETGLDPAQRGELTARRLAQWAVNAVDFRDADAIMTPFEYDVYPFDGWDVDGVIGSSDDSDPARRVVWGCEYPHLLISETFAMHDTRLVDSSWDTSTEKMKRDGSDEIPPDGEPDDDDLDQCRIPQGSLFVELYCAGHRTTPPHNPVVPPELYSPTPDGSWQLDLGRVAPASFDGTRYPVWRLAISASHLSEARSVRGQLAKHPETTTLQPEAFNVLDATQRIPIERIVWLSSHTPRRNTIDREKIFSAKPGAWSLLAPGQYAVVGPRGKTLVRAASSERKEPGLIVSLDLGPNGNVFGIGGPSAPLPPPVNIQPAVGIVAAMPRPASWSGVRNTAPEGIGLSVSEPLPSGANYYPEPKYRDPTANVAVTDAYALEGTTPHKYYDLPLDNDFGRPLKTDKLLGEGTKENYKTVFLQRLANPLAPFDTGANPYITVDWMPIDLTVFNSLEETPQDLPPTLRPFNSPQTIPREIMFATRQRGVPSGLGLTAENIWRAESVPGLGTGNEVRRSPPNLRHTLGYLNSTYGVPRGVPLKHSGDPPQPIPWLTFNNRPFVSQYELMLVPASAPQRLTYEHTVALPFNAYAPPLPPAQPFGSFRSPFGHLLNFFHTQAINGPLPSPSSHFYRLFEFTHVPSRFVGTETGGTGTQLPYGRISRFRDPGRVNLNTITNGRVWDGILNGHPGPNFEQLVDSRRGYIGTGMNVLLDDVPTLIANPFRAGLAGDLVPLPEMERSDVECTLLRSDAILRGQPPAEPLFISRSQDDYNHTERNPYFRYQGIQHLGNLVTTRSNVFAVWITVGYFEVQPGGHELGQEVGMEQGDIRRHRAFYVIDRSIPVGFELGINHNVDNAIILRRFIE